MKLFPTKRIIEYIKILHGKFNSSFGGISKMIDELNDY